MSTGFPGHNYTHYSSYRRFAQPDSKNPTTITISVTSYSLESSSPSHNSSNAEDENNTEHTSLFPQFNKDTFCQEYARQKNTCSFVGSVIKTIASFYPSQVDFTNPKNVTFEKVVQDAYQRPNGISDCILQYMGINVNIQKNELIKKEPESLKVGQAQVYDSDVYKLISTRQENFDY